MSKQPKIIITGASGFIGSELCSHFAQKKWTVFGMVKRIPERPVADVVYVKHDLSDKIDEAVFDGTDYLVHCAYVRNDIEHNVSGSRALLEASRKFKLKKNVFLSSFSAHEKAVSRYGQQKLRIEKLFSSVRDCNIRVGVVLGNGGLFKEMSDHIKLGKRIPLMDGGRQPMQTIHITDLVEVIEKVLTEDQSGTFTVAEAEPVTYRDFFTALSLKLNRKPKFIRVPFFVLAFALSVAKLLGIKLPVEKENVLGLKFIIKRETKNDLEKLGIKVHTFKESLDLL